MHATNTPTPSSPSLLSDGRGWDSFTTVPRTHTKRQREQTPQRAAVGRWLFYVRAPPAPLSPRAARIWRLNPCSAARTRRRKRPTPFSLAALGSLIVRLLPLERLTNSTSLPPPPLFFWNTPRLHARDSSLCSAAPRTPRNGEQAARRRLGGRGGNGARDCPRAAAAAARRRVMTQTSAKFTTVFLVARRAGKRLLDKWI